MRGNQYGFVAQVVGAMFLALLSLPMAAMAYTNCYVDGRCRTCFFYSDDGLHTYQGYMSGCAPAV